MRYLARLPRDGDDELVQRVAQAAAPRHFALEVPDYALEAAVPGPVADRTFFLGELDDDVGWRARGRGRGRISKSPWPILWSRYSIAQCSGRVAAIAGGYD